jgi:DUF309 family protein family protein
VTPPLPLGVRNRLADLILAALHDPAARRELTALASCRDAAPPPGWLAADERAHAGALLDRARRAARALDARPLASPDPDLTEMLAAAAGLFDAGLYFEVHEALEPYWARATGAERDALQGLIQIAVGYQHLAHDNLAGGRSLLGEGSFRLARSRVDALDTGAFVREVRATVSRLPAVDWDAVPRFPAPV